MGTDESGAAVTLSTVDDEGVAAVAPVDAARASEGASGGCEDRHSAPVKFDSLKHSRAYQEERDSRAAEQNEEMRRAETGESGKTKMEVLRGFYADAGEAFIESLPSDEEKTQSRNALNRLLAALEKKLAENAESFEN